MSYAAVSTISTVRPNPILSNGLLNMHKVFQAISSIITSTNGEKQASLQAGQESFVQLVSIPCQRIAESDSVYTGCSISYAGDASMEVNVKSIKKLRSFMDLPDDWNGYGAKQFSKDYICFAEYLLENLPIEAQVYPISDGRVQFEFDKDDGSYLEFEINRDKTVSVFEILPDDSEREYTAKSEEITRIVKQFYG